MENLLLHNEPHIALEVLCDVLKDHQISLPKKDFQKIKTLAEEMGEESSFVWEFLLIMDEETHKSKFALADETSWKEVKKRLLSILDDTKSELSQQSFETIKEYIYAGEYELALEDFVSYFSAADATVSQELFEKLAYLLAMFNFPEVDKSKFSFRKK